MSWYEMLLTLHILAAAIWLGSSLAILAIGRRALAAGTEPFSTFVVHAGWWGCRAHPAAGVVILLTGIGLVAEGDWSAGDLWIVIGILGVLAGFAAGGALIGRTAGQLVATVQSSGDGWRSRTVPRRSGCWCTRRWRSSPRRGGGRHGHHPARMSRTHRRSSGRVPTAQAWVGSRRD